jgi:hypothetical protein
MEEKREEIYERIPWETLQNPKSDRQTLIIGLAVAVAAGALVYSFVSNRSAHDVVPVSGESSTVTAPMTAPSTAAPFGPAAPLPPATAPESIAEADLYAISPAVLADAAVAHAEWFVYEYLTVDGSGENPTLRELLPEDIPLPVAPEGALVFVEWVKSLSAHEVEPGVFSVNVLAHYMVAEDGQDYRRVEPEVITVTVAMSEAGPQIASAPSVGPVVVEPIASSGLGAVPADVENLVFSSHPDVTIVGGVAHDGGAWGVVIVAAGPGGVLRPVTLLVQP